MNVILDTNCFINAVRQKCQAYEPLKIIFQASEVGKLTLLVSLHSLHELERKPDAAFALAQSLPLLPHFPIDAWMNRLEPGLSFQERGRMQNGTRRFKRN